MRARPRGIGVVAAMATLVIVGGGATASADRADDRRGLPGVNPCLQWGDLLPVQLTRGSAREAIACLVNAERREAGVRMLRPNRRLQRASQRHTVRMNGTGCFRHHCPGEPRLRKRLSRYFGADPRQFEYGEALAWAPAPLATPRETVAALMASPAHRYHLLRPIYRELGVGFTVGTPESALSVGGIYTLDFGMRTG